MADDEAGKFNVTVDDETPRGRPTNGILLAELGLVREIVQGHKDLTKQGFENVQRQLDDVRGLPTKVAELEQTMEGVVLRVEQMEKRWAGRLEYRRVNLPLIVFAAIASIVSLVELVTKLH